MSEGSSFTGLFYRIKRCSSTLAFDSANHRQALAIFQTDWPKQEGHQIAHYTGSPWRMTLSTTELSALDVLSSKLSYSAADKCETNSKKMINDLRAQLHIYSTLRWIESAASTPSI